MTSNSPRPPSIPGSTPQSPAPRHARLASSSVPPDVSSATLSIPQHSPYRVSNTDLTESQLPPFQPFFTLVSDASTNTTYHPRQIHYLFSDDDTEILTAACLDTLASPLPPQDSTLSVDSSSLEQHPPAKSRGKQPHSDIPKRRENRILLLDVDASGTQVTKAHSLTPSWQILSTSLVPAPTWEAANASQTEGTTDEGGMMLRIEGTDGGEVGRDTRGAGLGIDGGGVGEEDFGSIMAEFDDRMRVLKTVIGTGGGILLDDPDEDTTENKEGIQVQLDEPIR